MPCLTGTFIDHLFSVLGLNPSNSIPYTHSSLLTTLSDGKKAQFLAGYLNGRYRTKLKAELGEILNPEGKMSTIIKNAACVSGFFLSPFVSVLFCSFHCLQS